MGELLVLVESNTSGSGRQFARTAAALGYTPVMLAADPGRYAYVAQDALWAVKAHTADVDGVLAACRELGAKAKIAGITSSSEHFGATAANAAKALGLPGPDGDAIARCRSKEIQRQTFARAGLPSARFEAVTTAEDAERCAAALGLPVIVKPLSGTGSIGVRRCATVEELRTHARGLLSQTVNERGLKVEPRILVEECLVGTEVSAELFDAQLVGVTLKHPSALPWFVAQEHDFPGDLPAPLLAATGEVAIAAAGAMGLTRGPIHVELIITERGPHLVEINPRLAGAMIPELVRVSLGVDLIEATLRRVVGAEADLRARHARWASIRFLLRPGSGTLRAIDGLAEAAAVPGVLRVEATLEPGESLARLGDMRDRIAWAMAVCDSPAAARQAVGDAIARLVLRAE